MLFSFYFVTRTIPSRGLLFLQPNELSSDFTSDARCACAQIANCRLARCLLSACGFPYNWKAPTCCSLSASDVEVTQARSLPPCCDVYTRTRTQLLPNRAARGLGLFLHSLRACQLNVIKRNQTCQSALLPRPRPEAPCRRFRQVLRALARCVPPRPLRPRSFHAVP